MSTPEAVSQTAQGLAAKLWSLVGPSPDQSNLYLSVINGGIATKADNLKWLGLTDKDLLKSQEDLQQAKSLAKTLNSIAPRTGPWVQSAQSMATIFDDWVRNALYPKYELPLEHKAALVKADIITKANVAEYRKYKAIYDKAWNLSNKADPSDDNYDQLLQQTEDARMDWQILGNKEAYEAAAAEKIKLSGIGVATAFQKLRENYDAVWKDFKFAKTSVTPSNFYSDDNMWTTATFSSSESSSHSSTSATSWGGGASVSWGLWSVGASVSKSETQSYLNEVSQNMTIEFEFCRTPILRDWFEPYMLIGRDWWWNGATQTDKTLGGPQFSDGNGGGVWPTIPVEAIWTRNLKLTFNNTNVNASDISKTLSTSADVGFSFFAVSANYSSSSSTSDRKVSVNGNGITFPGMQLSAVLCQRMPMEPNPKDAYVSLFPATSAATLSAQSAAILRTPTILKKQELNNSHAALDGIMSGLLDKVKAVKDGTAAAWLKKKATELVNKGIDKAAQLAKQKLAEKLQKTKAQAQADVVVYQAAIATKDQWQSVSATNRKCCYDVVLSNDQLIEGAQIAARTQAANTDPAANAGASDVLSIAFFMGKCWPPGKIIRCRFLDGTPIKKKAVEKWAHHWEYFANIKFVFDDKDLAAEIRISFCADNGSWSLLGTDCLLSDWADKATMNFGWFTDHTSDFEFQRTVVHEFGHALGAVHELAQPTQRIRWNVEAVRNHYMTTQNWSAEKVDQQVFQKYSPEQLRGSTFDKDSIMCYPVPPELLLVPSDAIGLNMQLSDLDKHWASRHYPKAAGNGLSAPLDPTIAQKRGTLKKFLEQSHTGAVPSPPSLNGQPTALAAPSFRVNTDEFQPSKIHDKVYDFTIDSVPDFEVEKDSEALIQCVIKHKERTFPVQILQIGKNSDDCTVRAQSQETLGIDVSSSRMRFTNPDPNIGEDEDNKNFIAQVRSYKAVVDEEKEEKLSMMADGEIRILLTLGAPVYPIMYKEVLDNLSEVLLFDGSTLPAKVMQKRGTYQVVITMDVPLLRLADLQTLTYLAQTGDNRQVDITAAELV